MILDSSFMFSYSNTLNKILSTETGMEDFNTVGSALKYFTTYANKEKNAADAFRPDPANPNAQFDASAFKNDYLNEGLTGLSPEEKNSKISIRKKALDVGNILYNNKMSEEMSRIMKSVDKMQDSEKMNLGQSDPLLYSAFIALNTGSSAKTLFESYAKVDALNKLDNIPVRKFFNLFRKKMPNDVIESSKKLLEKYSFNIANNDFDVLEEVNNVTKSSRDSFKKIINSRKEFVLPKAESDNDLMKMATYIQIITNNSKHHNKDSLKEGFDSVINRKDLRNVDFSNITPFYHRE